MSGFPRGGGGTGAVTSVFTRTGAVVAVSGDYTAAEVTNAADTSSASAQVFSAEVEAPTLGTTGITGITAGRFLGVCAAGGPASGTFAAGDWTVDGNGVGWVCTTPGTVGGACVFTGMTTSAVTLTNKRITKRVLPLSAGSATPAINTDLYDVVHITAQGSTAITSFTSGLTGTPVDGDTLRISVIGSGAVGLTFGTSFEASTVPLPTTTVAATRLDMGFFWNTETNKWRCMSVA
jgi:hypothetical protein